MQVKAMTQAELLTMVYIFFARILDVSIVHEDRADLAGTGTSRPARLRGGLIWLTAASKALAS